MNDSDIPEPISPLEDPNMPDDHSVLRPEIQANAKPGLAEKIEHYASLRMKRLTPAATTLP
jgi:hypothetical protein